MGTDREATMAGLTPHKRRAKIARATRLVWFVLGTITLTGCASPELTGFFGPGSPFMAGNGAAVAGSGSPYAPFNSSQSTTSLAPPKPSYSPGGWSRSDAPVGVSPATENGFVASLREAANTVADAFTLEPKVIPAYDPVSLAGPPEQVGGDLHYHAARVYAAQGNVRAAMSHYRQALETSPDDYSMLVGLARLYDGQGDYPRAQATYERALHANPESPRALNDLGMCHARNGAFEDAVPRLERAAELVPMNKRYRNNLAAVFVELGRYDEALEHLAAVHGDAVAHYNLGFLLSRRQQNRLAQHHLARALQIDPNLTPARKMIDKIQAASLMKSGSGRPPLAAPRVSERDRPYRGALPNAALIRTLPPI
ncbi:MAG: tetratricopeptide repeat protein [Pirellulaceae bacterium]